eukprot:SAG11_NODE_197_length_12691_cov_20.904145_6_plen_137_part_00
MMVISLEKPGLKISRLRRCVGLAVALTTVALLLWRHWSTVIVPHIREQLKVAYSDELPEHKEVLLPGASDAELQPDAAERSYSGAKGGASATAAALRWRHVVEWLASVAGLEASAAPPPPYEPDADPELRAGARCV